MNIIIVQAWSSKFKDEQLNRNKLVCFIITSYDTKPVLAGGELIIPGTKVNVKWLDNWYEGKVLEVEHQDDLYKVINIFYNNM